MKITVSNTIQLEENQLPKSLKERIELDLTFTNPLYQQQLLFSKRRPTAPKHIYAYEKKSSLLLLPRGYLDQLQLLLDINKVKYKIVDEAVSLSKVHVKPDVKLRDYQEKAINALLKSEQGGLVAPCGAGKTIMMLGLMAKIEQPTLWIVHKLSLANEVIEKACNFYGFTNEEIGFIGNGKFKVGKRLTIGIIQTLSRRDLTEIKDKFGLILVDEAHHLPAETFYKTINQFPAKYRYWCTATPDREDDLTNMLYYGGGPILHTVERHELPTITPDVIVFKTSFNQVIENHTKTVKAMVQDENRNRVIVDTISKEIKTGNFHLVLSQRIDHLEILQEILQDLHPQLTIEVFHSNTKNGIEVMRRAKNKEIDILLATSQIAQEGLDIPHLNRLYLVTPKKATGTVEQEVGRIMRPSECKKDAIVYDFWDYRCPMVSKQFWNRRKVYHKLNMNITYKNLGGK